MEENKLFFSWINSLEKGSQTRFSEKTTITQATISRIKSGQKIGKASINKVLKAYDLSPQEYDAGPDAYDASQKKQPIPTSELVDINKLTPVILLTKVEKNIEKSPVYLHSTDFVFMSDFEKSRVIQIDEETEYFELFDLIAINHELDIKPDTICLIWSKKNNKAEFVYIKNDYKLPSGDIYLGRMFKSTHRIFLPKK